MGESLSPENPEDTMRTEFDRWWPAWYAGKDAWPADPHDNPHPYGSIERDGWHKGLMSAIWEDERERGVCGRGVLRRDRRPSARRGRQDRPALPGAITRSEIAVYGPPSDVGGPS